MAALILLKRLVYKDTFEDAFEGISSLSVVSSLKVYPNPVSRVGFVTSLGSPVTIDGVQRVKEHNRIVETSCIESVVLPAKFEIEPIGGTRIGSRRRLAKLYERYREIG